MALQSSQDLRDEIDNLVGIRREMESTVSEIYNRVRDNTKTIGAEIRGAYSNFLRTNRVIEEMAEITSKVGSEFVKMSNVNKRINEISAKRTLIESEYKKVLAATRAERQAVAAQILDENTALQDQLKIQEDLKNIDVRNLSGDDLIHHQLKVQATKEELTRIQDRLEELRSNKAVAETEMYRTMLKNLSKSEAEARKIASHVKEANKEVIKTMSNQKFKEKLADKFGMGGFAKDVGKFGLKGAGMLAAAGGVISIIEGIVKLMFKGSQQITDIRKQFSATRAEAETLRQYFGDVSNISTGVLTTMEDVLKAQTRIAELTGNTAIYRGQDLKAFTDILETANFTDESLKGILDYSNLTGKSFDKILNSVAGTSRVMQAQKGVSLDNRKILESVLKTTGSIRLNFKGNLEELTKAVTQAKIYGTTLEQVDKTAESLLNFEQSISSELEAELLTGKKLNLERARAAALNNDTMTVMQEMAKQVGTFDEYMNKNRIQQDAIAKAFGYTREEMADMLAEKKTMDELTKRGLFNTNMGVKENIAMLDKQGKLTDEIIDKIGRQTVDTIRLQSAGEQFGKVMGKMQDIVARLFDGGKLLEPLMIKIAVALEKFSKNGFFGMLFSGSDAELEKKYRAALAKPVEQQSPKMTNAALGYPNQYGGKGSGSQNKDIIVNNYTTVQTSLNGRRMGEGIYTSTTKTDKPNI